MGCICGKPSLGKSSTEDNIDLKAGFEEKKKLCIWMVGGPGSGKGTQCKMLATRFNLVHLSTGDLLRDVCKRKSENVDAVNIRKTMESGGLVDADAVLSLLLQTMKTEYPNCNGFLIDGYPREIKQGEMFCEKVGSPHGIIYLECPDDVLMERLLKRGKDSGRVDDNEETIKARLVTFHEVSEPVMERWKDKVINIDGTATALEVESECTLHIEKITKDFQINW